MVWVPQIPRIATGPLPGGRETSEYKRARDRVLIICMVAAIAQEARVLLETIRNSAERLYLANTRTTLDGYVKEKLNATRIGIEVWPLVCAWDYTPEIAPIMDGVRSEVQVQAGSHFLPMPPPHGIPGEKVAERENSHSRKRRLERWQRCWMSTVDCEELQSKERGS